MLDHSDEHISTVQYLQKASAVAGAIVVTTPEEVSLADVRKELSFCRKTSVPILGIVENMGSYQTRLSQLQFTDKTGADCTSQVLTALQEKCPEVLECMVKSDLFVADTGGAKKMAEDYGADFWGQLPLDPDLLVACEQGRSFVAQHPDSPAAKVLTEFCHRLNKALPVDMAH